ncbi:hypothetical protein SAMN04488029_2446 [Reichenbachiella faecimaris]|uniref:Uncharacterized protein n=1 Tax=Reichenbachiella faecimaris TaxID=692418 RepID=A0A1W2GF66_REIFA|nr:hypothetical protein [Reichenbachiella faecimaris]SMD35310.1 hypothetical protein SAMN04488029_2446 [Reichenbachiella faecimaris]
MHGSKLNQEATNTYSQSYSAKIAEEFFSQNDSISGQQIISITPVKQVNFFILKALFDEWQDEIKKFRSPYFDYKNEDVNQALKAFINTLSKHIQIDKEHFQPLLEKSVKATLELLYDPASYYTKELSKTASVDKSRELKASSKYIKLHKALFEDLWSRLNQGNDLQSAIQSALASYTDSNQEIEHITELFNSTLPLNVTDKQVDPEQFPMPEPLDTLEEIETVAPEESTSQDEINDEFEPVEKEELEAESHSINQQYKGDIKTLNQRYEEKEKAKTVAAALETKSLSNLKNNININQRYMFVNDLFEGHDKDYEIAMDQVEDCDSFDSSVELLVQNYAKKYDWDMNSDEVKELLKVIFKRFR